MIPQLSERTFRRYSFLLLFVVMTGTWSLFSQETEEADPLDALLDELFFDEQQFVEDILEAIGKKNFIYTSLSFNNNTFFSGRKAGIDQFNLVPQISYYHKSGFTGTVSGIYYETFEPNWDFTSLSLGYFKSFGKRENIQFYGGYTRYFYTNESGVFTNSLDLSLGARTNSKALGFRISGSYLFGNDESLQLVLNTYANITLSKQSNYTLKFRPQLNFIVAQQTIALEQLIIVGDGLEFQIVKNEVFDLLNTQISLPFRFTTRTWDIEAGYHFNLPNPVAAEQNLPTTGFISLALGYLFDLK